MARKFKPGDRVMFKPEKGDPRRVCKDNIGVVMSSERDWLGKVSYDVAWPDGSIGLIYADEMEKAPLPQPTKRDSCRWEVRLTSTP